MESILDLNNISARDYLLQSSSYCTINLPSYIDFTNVLDFVKKKVGNKDWQSCIMDSNRKPSSYEGVNYQILVNKDGGYSYRRMQLANPYIYYFLVRTITEESNWEEIQQHFNNRECPTISVESIPKIKPSTQKHQGGVDIPSWWEGFEQKSIELALRYQYMFITDITDCYGSIYTHTIPWSLYGKNAAKQNRQKSSLGKSIDDFLSAMNYNQTNGIPQGSVLFDLIAEIVLAYADHQLYESLKKDGVVDDDYFVLRYRDDYRIFCNSKDILEKIIRHLHNVLSGLNFRMNPSKTKLSQDVVLDSIKSDKLSYLSSRAIYIDKEPACDRIQNELFYILQFSKKHPNSGVVVRLLSLLLNRIREDIPKEENLKVLISITTEIMLSSPRVFSVGTALISHFLNGFDKGKAAILKDVYTKLRRLPNTGELEIWLQRISFHLKDSDIHYDEPLTDIVDGLPFYDIWENSWVKKELHTGFPLLSICNNEVRDSQTPIIESDEVDIFSYWG